MAKQWRQAPAGARWQRGIIVMPKGKMTLDKLAGMFKLGFDAVDSRFKELEARMEARFDALEQGQEAMEIRLGAIERQLRQAVYQFEFQALDGRVARLERKVGIKSK